MIFSAPAQFQIDCDSPAVQCMNDKPFFSSTSGILVLALIPVTATVLGVYIRRQFKTINDVTALLPRVTALETTSGKHAELHASATTTLERINTTLTNHLQWAQQEYTLYRESQSRERSDSG